jgi:hypothetical protein
MGQGKSSRNWSNRSCQVHLEGCSRTMIWHSMSSSGARLRAADRVWYKSFPVFPQCIPSSMIPFCQGIFACYRSTQICFKLYLGHKYVLVQFTRKEERKKMYKQQGVFFFRQWCCSVPFVYFQGERCGVMRFTRISTSPGSARVWVDDVAVGRSTLSLDTNA